MLSPVISRSDLVFPQQDVLSQLDKNLAPSAGTSAPMGMASQREAQAIDCNQAVHEMLVRSPSPWTLYALQWKLYSEV